MTEGKRDTKEQTSSAFSELIRELNRLSDDTRTLTDLARTRIEDQWFLGHAEIFPLLSLWKERVKAATFSTFDVARTVMYFKPLLSDGASPQFIDEPEAQAKAMDAAFGAGTAHLVCLAIASQDMHCDFRTGSIVFPVVLFERTCGIVLGRIPALKVEAYEALASETGRVLEGVRRSVLQRHLPDSHWLAKAS